MKKEEFEGLKRYEIIAPLLGDELEPAQKRCLRKEIVEKHGISERTLRRYLRKYGEKGYEGLVKPQRGDKGSSKRLSADVLKEAIKLRRELPGRSARRIITILESEGIAAPGEIAKSTLSRQLKQNGVSTADLKALAAPGTGARRFQKEHRNALWQSDIKYGPYIPGKNGKKVRTYLIVLIDDATRRVVHAEIYDNQRLPILEDCFKKAILKYGIPEAIYVDNGKIFVSKWFRLACARIGVRHIHTKPYSPQSKGKIERFNGFTEEFLEELTLEPADSLESLNQKFRVWLEEGYTHKPHSALGGKTPYQAYTEDPKATKPASSADCLRLFLWEETRKVDKTGAIRHRGNVYDAGSDLINKKVDVRFNPFDLSGVEIWHDGLFIRRCVPLVIPEFIKKSRSKDQAETKAETPTEPTAPSRSRLLAAYEKQDEQRDKKKNCAISFAGMEKEDKQNV